MSHWNDRKRLKSELPTGTASHAHQALPQLASSIPPSPTDTLVDQPVAVSARSADLVRDAGEAGAQSKATADPSAGAGAMLPAAARCVEAVLRDGVGAMPSALMPSLCDALAGAVTGRLEAVLSRLQVHGVDPYAPECPPFTFKEVASRCPGRIDIRFAPSSLAHTLLSRADDVAEVCRGVLGSDATLLYTGVVDSFGHSDDQGWHVDGDHLAETQLPPHALTVFIATSTVDPAAGLPEFFLQSHRLVEAAKLTAGVEPVDPPVTFPLDRATAVIFDYRTVHRGTANRTLTDRPLVYCVFGKRGWQDTANFNTADSLFEPPAATATAAVQ
eukprot:m.61577 g.61577  ORF g.61577 m.61577 type:complete len:330 (+) comp17583_c0_seq1:290-1279(+)